MQTPLVEVANPRSTCGWSVGRERACRRLSHSDFRSANNYTWTGLKEPKVNVSLKSTSKSWLCNCWYTGLWLLQLSGVSIAPRGTAAAAATTFTRLSPHTARVTIAAHHCCTHLWRNGLAWVERLVSLGGFHYFKYQKLRF
jgi:hypothetical protein